MENGELGMPQTVASEVKAVVMEGKDSSGIEGIDGNIDRGASQGILP